MPNIPGATYPIPYSDPIIPMMLEKDGATLTTDSWGYDFVLDGNIKLIALAVLEYALRIKGIGCLGLSFSRFDFKFENKTIEIKELSGRESAESLLVVEEIKNILKLKAFW